MQTLTLEGYMAADPSILSAQGSSKKRASFRVLETTRYRKADGTPGERTTGFNCICFNEATTENYIEPFARKGSRVVIQGHVENDTWTGKDGVEHYDLRLIVGDIRLKNRRDRVGREDSQIDAGVQEQSGGYDLNDDIPF
ncbi:Single-stranded DNA-binding protein [Brevundimonas sp. NIBR10]|uniref:single-stranded DNA-binding protein n=1 Tax=Brevundimonas sp. NIBR10 TaxID=3015997 RepID=UPI0022F1CE52|nr:single-stranded DNA-binding protein [Brevundimonas sp. NIBR10]WGM47198.1 Single-stranded DNA-binding protein [Brevundimonas sp. NIBR10]